MNKTKNGMHSFLVNALEPNASEKMGIIQCRPYLNDMKAAYIGGTFDTLHVGHLHLLERARRLFDYVIVSVNTDEFSEHFKRKPVVPLDQRMKMLSALKCVDMVISNIGGADTGRTIDELRAQNIDISAIIHGSDWTGEKYMKQLGITKEWLEDRGIVICYFDYTETTSTSAIIERCKKV